MSDQPNTSWQKQLSSPLLWHLIGSGALLLLVIFLTVRFVMDWSTTNTSHSDILTNKQVELKALDLQTAPLRGLEQRVADSHAQIESFYNRRIPTTYSQISERIGALQIKSGVRLTRVQYSQGKPGNELTEISLDTGISGNYPEIMRYVNALERDPYFFVIRAMSLTGQQGGTVNLRLRVSTWMRPSDAEATGLPLTSDLKNDKEEK